MFISDYIKVFAHDHLIKSLAIPYNLEKDNNQ